MKLGIKRNENMGIALWILLTIISVVISIAPVVFIGWAIVKLLSILQGWSV